MRILFLADADSSHTRKWAVGLHKRGFTIAIFSLRKSAAGWNAEYPGIRIYDADAYAKEKFGKADARKISYLKFTEQVREIIASFKPDIVHAHYATSYGLLGVKTKFHPLVISAWGSDVFEFPEKSILHRYLVKRNLRKADAVFSTSEVMKKQIQKLGRNDVVVTPFGVDLSVYKRRPVKRLFDEDTKVVGTIKTLEPHYGIGVLLWAFAKVKMEYKGKVKLVICGTGSQMVELKEMAISLEISDDVLFTGAISQDDVPYYLNNFDVFVNPSLRESFGVSVIEAMACEVPVVLSNADGPKEISGNGKFAIMVKAQDAGDTALAISRLLKEPSFAKELSEKALQHVRAKYDWERNLDSIIVHYTKLVKK